MTDSKTRTKAPKGPLLALEYFDLQDKIEHATEKLRIMPEGSDRQANQKRHIGGLAARIAELEEPIREAVSAVNGTAAAFTLSPTEVLNGLRRAERALREFALPKTLIRGTVYVARSAGPSTSSYKYGAAGTLVKFTRSDAGWQATRIERAKAFPKARGVSALRLPKAAAERLKDRMIDGWDV